MARWGDRVFPASSRPLGLWAWVAGSGLAWPALAVTSSAPRFPRLWWGEWYGGVGGAGRRGAGEACDPVPVSQALSLLLLLLLLLVLFSR